MTRKTRKILFYSSIGLFLILSTAVVLFALGYGYDFSKNQILKTGGFGVTANTGISVYIDDQLVGSTSFLSNSYSKSRLLPGSYAVRVEADGYDSWQKQIEIQEGAFTDFPSIVLLSTELNPQPLKTNKLPTNISSLYYYKNVFYFLSGGQLISYDIETSKQEVSVKKVEAFFPNGDTITYRGSDKNFYTFSLNNQGNKPLPLPAVDPRFAEGSGGASIKNIQKFITVNDSIYFVAKTGTQSSLYQTKGDQTTKLASNVTGFELSPDGVKLLYHNSHEIYVLYLRDTSYQPYKTANETNLLTRTSRTISNVQWYKDSSHALINASGNLVFTELDDRGERNSYDIINPVSWFYYDSGNDVIYTLVNSTLNKIELK